MAKLLVSREVIEVEGGITIEDAVLSQSMHPDSYLYMMNGKPVPMDTVIPEDGEVKVVRVASGG